MGGQPWGHAKVSGVIVVDTTVWVEFFRCAETPEDLHLQQLILDGRTVALSSLIDCEILQGIRDNAHYARVRQVVLQYPVLEKKNLETFEQNAQIYRACRRRGLTIRKTIDWLIAAVCITNGAELFHKDVDFTFIAQATSLKVYQIPST